MNRQHHAGPTGLRFLVFDLDDTLYPPGSGLFYEVGGRIHRYLQERMGFPESEVAQVRRRYYEQYGTTLRGLQINHQVDTDDYLRFVHDVDVARYLRPDPALDAALDKLPQEKVLFTNATAEYAERVMAVLGVARHFRRIVDIYALDFYCKPSPEAYRILLEALPARGPECLLVEDNLRNLRVGAGLGMRTVWVQPKPGDQDGAEWIVASAAEVAEVVRQIAAE
jgi:putative hydrolase of the HAD superfamily